MPLPGSSTVLLPLAVRVVVLLLLCHIWVVKKNCLDHFGRFVVTHVLFDVVVACLNATTTTIHVSL